MVIGDLSTAVDVVVLGGGPGGYVAAIRAAQLGKQVALVEASALGGACLNLGCIPSKALLSAAGLARRLPQLDAMGIGVSEYQIDFGKMQTWKNGLIKRLSQGVQQLLKSNKVQIVHGRGWFISESDIRIEGEHGSQRFSFEQCIIATGAEPASLSGLEFDGKRVFTPGQALAFAQLPADMLVIGSDYIAAELATLYCKLGVPTRLLVPAGQTLLGVFDPLAARQVSTSLKKAGAKIETDVTDIATASQTASAIVISIGQTGRSGDLALEEIGLIADDDGFIAVNAQMQSSNPNIYAIGDVTGGLALATTAIKQGKVAAEHSAGKATQYAPQALPQVAWTDPALACAGLSLEQAKAAGYDAVSERFPLAANGRALTLGQSDGFAMIVAERNSEVILGATLVGAGAESVIGEVALALEMGATLTDLAETLHPHPGLGEPLQEAAEMVLGFPVHAARGV